LVSEIEGFASHFHIQSPLSIENTDEVLHLATVSIIEISSSMQDIYSCYQVQ